MHITSSKRSEVIDEELVPYLLQARRVWEYTSFSTDLYQNLKLTSGAISTLILSLVELLHSFQVKNNIAEAAFYPQTTHQAYQVNMI